VLHTVHHSPPSSGACRIPILSLRILWLWLWLCLCLCLCLWLCLCLCLWLYLAPAHTHVHISSRQRTWNLGCHYCTSWPRPSPLRRMRRSRRHLHLDACGALNPISTSTHVARLGYCNPALCNSTHTVSLSSPIGAVHGAVLLRCSRRSHGGHPPPIDAISLCCTLCHTSLTQWTFSIDRHVLAAHCLCGCMLSDLP
jgi:hypothetical protein